MKSSHEVQSQNGLKVQPTSQIQLIPEKVIRFFIFTIVGLGCAHLGGQFTKYILGYGSLKGLIPLFDLDREANIPSLYSGLALLLCGVVLSMIAIVKKQQRDRYCRHWQGLAIIFAYLGVDEMAEIHELTGKPLRDLFNATGIFYFTWVILGFALVAAFILVYRKFTFALPPQTRKRFILAACLYLAGALGTELIGGYIAYTSEKQSLLYAMFVAVEEVLEMSGIAIFLYALLTYLRSQVSNITIHLGHSFNSEQPSLSVPEGTKQQQANP
ncbi:MAG: hypothetical protein F6K32_04175 [Desertifilum sp. SIO1I2]|nr:hypothetical protein [Desertifilum sp. SIO1I2]